MNRHPLLHAYLAGIAIPTVFLLVVATSFTFLRYVYNVPVPIERVIVFPMAFVPNAWYKLRRLTQTPLQLQQFGEFLRIDHWRFAGEIFADVSGWFSIDRRHGRNRFIFLANIFLTFSAIREK